MVSTLVGTESLCHVRLMPCHHSITLALRRRIHRLAESACIDYLPFPLLLILCMTLWAGQSIAAEIDGQSKALTQALGLISSERMLADIRTLSGPAFNGRQTGTPDDLASAEFVRQRFLDLQQPRAPGSESPGATAQPPAPVHLQSAPVHTTKIDDDSLLQIGGIAERQPAVVGSDYLPILDSPSAELEASIVFVGYGISDPAGGFDDYAGIDVRNKVVFFLRENPNGMPHMFLTQIKHTWPTHTAPSAT